ncbi:MAG: hypothetical protein ABUK01_13085 [Leptospirales bacterium]
MKLDLNELSKSQFQLFKKEGWPSAILFTGQQTKSKHATIMEHTLDSLFEAQHNVEGKSERTRENIKKLAEEGQHPDFYIFPRQRIKIGTGSKPDPGTIRHLLDHVLIYAPRMGSTRFIYFEDASYINDEAESALLKSLEEPPPNTHFILSVWEPGLLKETIVSRSRIVPVEFQFDPSMVPNDPWERFWFLSKWNDTEEYDFMAQNGWVEYLKTQYDLLNFSTPDYIPLENIGWTEFTKTFKKESVDRQTVFMKLTFLPLYFSIRDRLIDGKGPSVGPLNFPEMDKRRLLYLSHLLESFFQRLQTRYFGTRSPAIQILFFSFLSAFMDKWPR